MYTVSIFQTLNPWWSVTLDKIVYIHEVRFERTCWNNKTLYLEVAIDGKRTKQHTELASRSKQETTVYAPIVPQRGNLVIIRTEMSADNDTKSLLVLCDVIVYAFGKCKITIMHFTILKMIVIV